MSEPARHPWSPVALARVNVPLRQVARAILAILFALLLFGLWTTVSGRGFLPSHRRTIHIESRAAADGTRTFAVLPTTDPSEPLRPSSATRYEILESSMGRTDSGAFSSWRATTWIITETAEPDKDPAPWPEHATPDPALVSFVETQIIPQSPGLAYWPQTPAPRTRDGAQWMVWQHRTDFPSLFFIIAACAGTAMLVSYIVLPRHPRREIVASAQ